MNFKLQKDVPFFKKKFSNKQSFVTKDVFKFFSARNKKLSRTAVHWRIHVLKKLGVITTLGKGEYRLSDPRSVKEIFQPKIQKSHQRYFAKIKKQYPLALVCLWPVRCLHEFMTHLPVVDWLIIEVEKEVSESLYAFLKENRHDVYLNPTVKDMEQSVAYDRKAVIMKNLVSESPVVRQDAIIFPTIEKILVDLFVDQVIFDVYQGSELVNIFQGAFEKYQINLMRLKRYARRRQVWGSVQEYVQKYVEDENR